MINNARREISVIINQEGIGWKEIINSRVPINSGTAINNNTRRNTRCFTSEVRLFLVGLLTKYFGTIKTK